MGNIAEKIGDRIRTIRKEKGMSQEELAHRANIHPSHMGQLERGEKSPTLDSLDKIVQALEITFQDLFKITEANQNSMILDKDAQNQVINKIVCKLQGRSLQEQETAYKLLKLFFSWKDIPDGKKE